MNDKQMVTKSFDTLKWSLVFLLFISGVVANHFFSDVASALRAIGWIILLSIIGVIASFTHKGKLAIVFSKEAKQELRKVIWPVRQETVKTTLLVIVLVLIMGLLMWAVDSILFKFIEFLTGQ